MEIYIAASFATCARRDPKGLYAKASTGAVAQFTGRDSAFEPPADGEPGLVLDTETATAEATLARLHGAVVPRLRL